MFKIEFDTNNDAFCDGNNIDEVRRILDNIANSVTYGKREGVVHDINGNQIGYWVLNEEGR